MNAGLYEQFMNLLFEIYVSEYPMTWVRDPTPVLGERSTPEAGMVVRTIITTLCTAGIAFYLRFLVALCEESRLHWIGYLVRLHVDSNENIVSASQEGETSLPHAA
jgi:hypothetical protein